MKIWRWIASIALSITIGFFIVAAFIYSPEEATVQPPTETKEETEVQEILKEPIEEEPPDEEPSDPTETEEPTLREGIRDVFTSVIESAKDLFIREDLHITALGDSLTQGVGDATDQGGYVGILDQTFDSNPNAGDVEIDNFGKRGNRTDQLLKRLNNEEEITSSIKQSDIVIITIGANDVMEVVQDNFTNLNYQAFVKAQEGYEERLSEIIQTVNETNPDASIYLVGLYNPFKAYFNNIPELGQIMSDWNEISRQVVEESNRTTFIPIKDVFENSSENLLWEEDYFHPNERGYKRIAERVLEYIKEDIER